MAYYCVVPNNTDKTGYTALME